MVTPAPATGPVKLTVDAGANATTAAGEPYGQLLQSFESVTHVTKSR